MTSGPPASSTVLPDGWTWGDVGHGALDVAGLVPVFGEGADLANAAWHAAEGNYLDAGLSVISMVPIVGDAIGKGGKLLKKGGGKLAGPALDALKKMDFDAMLKPLANHPKLGPHVEKISEALEKWRKELVGEFPSPTLGGLQRCALTDGLAKSSGQAANEFAGKLAQQSTHSVGSADRVVLGKWPGYIEEAKKNGGTWFETPPNFFNQLNEELGDEAAEKAWLVNEAFLRQQLASGKGAIEMTAEGLAHAAANPQSMTARELRFLQTEAAKHGYVKSGPTSWVRGK